MKKDILIPIMTWLIISILGIFFQYIPEKINNPNGIFSINLIPVNNIKYYHIKLENISDKNQNELKFLIKNSKKLAIKSTDYVDYKIDFSKSDTSICILTINQLPKDILNLTISGIESDISFINNTDKKYISSDILAKSNLNIIKIILIKTLIFTTIILLSFFYMKKHFDAKYVELTAKIVKLNAERLEIENKYSEKYVEIENKYSEKCVEIENKITRQKNADMKINLLLSAKVRDYVKELDFWKDMVSKILIEEHSIKPKEFFNNITEKLKTYGTRKITDHQINMAEYIEKTTKLE